MLTAMDLQFLMFVLACASAQRHDWDETNDRDFDEAMDTLLAKLASLSDEAADARFDDRMKAVWERLNDA